MDELRAGGWLLAAGPPAVVLRELFADPPLWADGLLLVAGWLLTGALVGELRGPSFADPPPWAGGWLLAATWLLVTALCPAVPLDPPLVFASDVTGVPLLSVVPSLSVSPLLSVLVVEEFCATLDCCGAVPLMLCAVLPLPGAPPVAFAAVAVGSEAVTVEPPPPDGAFVAIPWVMPLPPGVGFPDGFPDGFLPPFVMLRMAVMAASVAAVAMARDMVLPKLLLSPSAAFPKSSMYAAVGMARKPIASNIFTI